MIISASRRTDIPAYYSVWMLNRIKEKFVHVRNPFNYNQVSKIDLDPEVVNCIVFWSKNPKPMLDKLQHFENYSFYFQFTLNPYDNDIEIKLPPKNELIDTFKMLSDIIGSQRIIWRYDPILTNERTQLKQRVQQKQPYTIDYHINKFAEMVYQLNGYTEKVIISFIDFYKKISENLMLNNIIEIPFEEKLIIAENFSKIAQEYNLLIETCAEDIDLFQFNIGHAKCIDDRLISKISGKNLSINKDKNQRLECGCVKSIDIGSYNSCLNNCIYCYANSNQETVKSNFEKHDKLSPLLIGSSA